MDEHSIKRMQKNNKFIPDFIFILFSKSNYYRKFSNEILVYKTNYKEF